MLTLGSGGPAYAFAFGDAFASAFGSALAFG